jgi:hypothetical protein
MIVIAIIVSMIVIAIVVPMMVIAIVVSMMVIAMVMSMIVIVFLVIVVVVVVIDGTSQGRLIVKACYDSRSVTAKLEKIPSFLEWACCRKGSLWRALEVRRELTEGCRSERNAVEEDTSVVVDVEDDAQPLGLAILRQVEEASVADLLVVSYPEAQVCVDAYPFTAWDRVRIDRIFADRVRVIPGHSSVGRELVERIPAWRRPVAADHHNCLLLVVIRGESRGNQTHREKQQQQRGTQDGLSHASPFCRCQRSWAP